MVWSTSPEIDNANPVATNTVTYNDEAPVPRWCNWFIGGMAVQEMYGDGFLSMELASKTENNAGWAYFTKREFDESLAPNVLYAYKAPNLVLLQMDLDTTTVKGGQTIHGRIYSNYPASIGGTSIDIATGNGTKAMVETVTIPAGETATDFYVSTAIVTQSVNVTVGSGSLEKTITITP